jgi:hypothetical protein
MTSKIAVGSEDYFVILLKFAGETEKPIEVAEAMIRKDEKGIRVQFILKGIQSDALQNERY